jgi:O-antigen ligase
MGFQKLSKYSFFAFLFFLPFQTVLLLREPMIGGEKWQYGTIGLYGVDILLLAALVFHLSSRAQSRDLHMKWRIPRLADSLGMTEGILILFLLWVGASVFWATDTVLAGYFFAKLLLGAGCSSLRSLDDTGVGMAVKVLLAAAVIQVLIGIGQFLYQTAPASTLLGMSAHEAWTAGTSVLKLEDGRFLRAYGSFPHPNILGGFLAVMLISGISYLVSGVADRQTAAKNVIPSVAEGSQQRKSKIPRLADSLEMTIKRSVLIAGLLIILLVLILTFSRAAWLGVAMGIAAYCVSRIRYYASEKKHMEFGGNIISRPWNYVTGVQRVSGVLLAVGMAAAVFVFVLRDQVFPRFDAATIEREGSVSERMVVLQDAKALIIEHPFFGVGAGNFTVAVMENEPSRPIWSIQPAHNVFVLVLAELGAVGLVLFVLFVFSIVRQSVIPSVVEGSSCAREDSSTRRLAWNDNQNQFIIFAIAFLVLLPSLLLDHWLWSSHFGLLFFFLLAGFVARKH